MFKVVNAFKDQTTFQRLTETYQIDFVIAPRPSTKFHKLTVGTSSRFVPVFFDDAHVLYVDQELRPGIAAEYELRAVDPHDLQTVNGTIEEQLAELKRIAGIHPEGYWVNHTLIWTLFLDRRYSEAMHYAQAFVRHEFFDPALFKLGAEAVEAGRDVEVEGGEEGGTEGESGGGRRGGHGI